jgi:hypothetical protein
VESALDEVATVLKSDYLGLEVINGNESTSWPICMVSFVMVSVANNLSDCSFSQGLMKFIAWSQLNPRVIAGVKSDLNMVPLPFGYKSYRYSRLADGLLILSNPSADNQPMSLDNLRKMIDLMGLVTCNGNRAYDVTMLIGEGLLFNLYPAWMDSYSSSNIELKYFENPTTTAITDLIASTQPTTPPATSAAAATVVCCLSWFHWGGDVILTPLDCLQTLWTLAP